MAAQVDNGYNTGELTPLLLFFLFTLSTAASAVCGPFVCQPRDDFHLSPPLSISLSLMSQSSDLLTRVVQTLIIIVSKRFSHPAVASAYFASLLLYSTRLISPPLFLPPTC